MTARGHLAAEAWAALLQAHARLVPEIDQVLRSRVGLPLTHYDVLLELAAGPGEGSRMSDLGERTVLSRTRVSRVVDLLVADDLVSRRVDADDQRSSLVTLTDAGRALLHRAEPVYLAAIEELFATDLDRDQLTAVRDALSAAAHTDGRVTFVTRR